jgi:hypothetical protein
VINYNTVSKTFYLRKESSINLLNTLTSQWGFYTRLFTVQSGMDEKNGTFTNSSYYKTTFNGESRIHDFSSTQNYNNEFKTINFLTTGQQAATFSWQDKRTLSQIEKMTGYKVKPRGVVSQIKHGGFVVYEENGHGLIAAISDLGEMNWNRAKWACDNLILNGYSDWHLPTKEELNSIYIHLKKQLGVCGDGGSYWSSTEYDSRYEIGLNAWKQDIFGKGEKIPDEKIYSNNVRAVRSF